MKAIRDFSKSSSFSLSALFTGLLMLGVFFIAYFVVISSDETLLRESEAAIELDTKGIQEIYMLAGIEGVSATLENRIRDPDNSSFYVLRRFQQPPVLSNLGQWPTNTDTKRYQGLVVFNIDQATNLNSTRVEQGSEILAKTLNFKHGYQLLVGRSIDDLEAAQWVGKTFGWAIIFVLCLIAGVSLWVGHYVVSRINDISDTADRIMNTGDLSARLPVESTWDDLSQLAVSLNRMLEEIELSVNNIKSVSDSIAHDLRTPLTRMRQRIEDQFDEPTARPLLNEADNLLSMFNGLLRIADIETDKQRSAFAEIEVSAIIDDVIELYQPVAEQKGITLEKTLEPIRLFCDRDLMFQCIANILDNAIKFNHRGGHISVYAGQIKETIIIRIDDDGIGIDASQHANITRRFFRADKSRATKGNGLGMAMVAAIIKLHLGKLSFADDPLGYGSGLGTIVRFPTR